MERKCNTCGGSALSRGLCGRCLVAEYDVAMARIGVRIGFSPEQATSAYKVLRNRHHPDRPAGDATLYAELERAYDLLVPKPKMPPNESHIPDQHGDARLYQQMQERSAEAAAHKVQEMLNADDRAAAEKEKVADRVAADPGELEGEDCSLLVDLQGLILGRSPKF